MKTAEQIIALPDDAILTPDEVSVWIGLPKTWVRTHSGDGLEPRIPGAKMGARWKYRKGAVAAWLREILPGVTA